MLEATKLILLMESVLIVNAIMAFTFWKLRQNRIAAEKQLNEETKALYKKLINNEPALSLSLGQEECQSSSCPSFIHHVCEDENEKWVLTY